LAGDKDLKNRGRSDQAKGAVKGAVEKAIDSVSERSEKKK
jgi:uncharacterized protein YjbJ (UPF0337 family)